MTQHQAYVRNVRTCHLNVKGATQAEDLQESEYQCRVVLELFGLAGRFVTPLI
ncbi:hypothetical protein [Photorhabdus sp. RW14-46]|uniref:hypothetical protein n=1 Tax=Photorhabdus sp. RW14-46 TaxID=2100168 RepID=UPI001A97DA73|nr:hypothetical protein [Photorhabdus sp. RW14-46]